MSQIELRPGLADVPVAESAVSFIDGKTCPSRISWHRRRAPCPRKLLRGKPAWLLLKGDLPHAASSLPSSTTSSGTIAASSFASPI